MSAQRNAYSGKELTEFINRELELRGEPTITSRTTLMDDLLNIENEYHTNIVRKKHGRQTTYQYEDSNFSIFSPSSLRTTFCISPKPWTFSSVSMACRRPTGCRSSAPA